MFNGTKIKIGEEEFIIPPISLGMLRNGLAEKFKEHDEVVANGADLFTLMPLRGEIILAAAQRNHPNLTEEKLFSYLDMRNIGPLWLSVLGASGFNSGEVQAATEATSGISGPSIAASPLPTAGPTPK